ncbi:MAG TPA: hypothetical protein VJQ48_07875, partial [Candidatus Binatia bacterium]|nr:hypothetical protein [Candidatus Binatia bacterium]
MTVRSDVDLYKSSLLSPSLSSLPPAGKRIKERSRKARRSRRIDVAGQGWPSDSRNGPVPLHQLPKGREHIDQQRDCKLRN